MQAYAFFFSAVYQEKFFTTLQNAFVFLHFIYGHSWKMSKISENSLIVYFGHYHQKYTIIGGSMVNMTHVKYTHMFDGSIRR